MHWSCERRSFQLYLPFCTVLKDAVSRVSAKWIIAQYQPHQVSLKSMADVSPGGLPFTHSRFESKRNWHFVSEHLTHPTCWVQALSKVSFRHSPDLEKIEINFEATYVLLFQTLTEFDFSCISQLHHLRTLALKGHGAVVVNFGLKGLPSSLVTLRVCLSLKLSGRPRFLPADLPRNLEELWLPWLEIDESQSVSSWPKAISSLSFKSATWKDTTL